MTQSVWFDPLTQITPTSYPCTKFVVPSTGSMIHVGLSVKMHGSPFATDSSPMKLQKNRWTNIKIWQSNFVPLLQTAQAHKDPYQGVCVCVYVSPVCALSKFLFKRPNDDFLHPLVSLSDEVYSGALCHDPYFTLPGFSNFLKKWNNIGTCLTCGG